ncbi:MAG: Calx-beta domain-containing protein [Actinomycetota bacterium]
MSNGARSTMRRHPTALRLLVTLLVTAVAGAGSAIPAQAHPAMHCLLGLDGFQPPASLAEPYFYGAEGSSVGFLVRRRDSDVCSLDPNTYVHFSTVDGTATAAEGDFQLQDDETVDLVNGVGPASVPLLDDTSVEPVVESFQINLHTPEQGWLIGGPNPVPAYIIDLDGETRVAFRESTLVQSETKTSVKIPVFMAGPIADPVEVGFTVQPGPTNPATAGADYQPPADVPLSFTSSNRAQSIQFTINNDTEIENAETIQISLEAGAGYQLATPSVLTLTIQDNDRDFIPPTTRWHHPRQGKLYSYGDYRLREVHVFFDDQGSPPSGVVAVEMALRKKRLNGSCAWWVKGEWKAGRCSAKRWLPMKFDFDLYLKRFRSPLRPSVGTRIKNYTAWCRGIDGAGNVETSFAKGRNLSTFEVAKR